MHYNPCVSTSRLDLLRLLTSRLEHLSVDSRWARRASGLRGNLVKLLEEVDAGAQVSPDRIDGLIQRSFEILRAAAGEIPDIEAMHRKFINAK